MATAQMIAKILEGTQILFERDVEIKDGHKDSIRPAMLGFNNQIYFDTGMLLKAPPLGPPEEVIKITMQYEITYEGVGQVYYTETILEGKRFIIVACLHGMRVPFHEDVMKFINEYFVG